MDESLIQSVLVGILLLLTLAWILVIRNRLWQVWLGRRYAATVDAVVGELGLSLREGWRPAVEARGRRDGVRLRIAWSGGTRPHRVVVSLRRGLRWRRAILRPDASLETIRARVDTLKAGFRT
ncbi:MAG: hypothetical protein JXB39_15025 [Deltaproteobacteria bacterium]|nr:hypothetical protein [Deltaproteobacteria bacterium]